MMRWAQRLALVVVLVELLLLGGYWSLHSFFDWAMGTPSNDEIVRVAAPDGRVDAVLVQRNVHATVGYIYLVYVVPSGRAISDSDDEVFRAMEAESLNIEWIADRRLTIKYREAEIYQFRNLSYPLAPGDFQYAVRISEQAVSKGGV